MKIAALQINSLPYQQTKINYYLSTLKSKKVSLLVIGEYVLNLFFKEIETSSLAMIKEQSVRQYELFKKLSTQYNMIIIAPLIYVEKEEVKKTVVKFSPHSTKRYDQQVLMPYTFWNEKKFFSNDKKESPMVFTLEGFRIGVMFGYEAHFDEFWSYFRQKRVHLVVVPSVSTFESNDRWFEMLKTFAFLNNCYVLRVNRVGQYEEWKFYGESFLIDPHGEAVNRLGDKEELLIEEITKESVTQARRDWGFVSSRKENSFFE